MPRKIGKNVAKKSRTKSTIRNQKVSRSSRRNSRRNSVVKRKNKSRRKQRGRGDSSNNPPDLLECETHDANRSVFAERPFCLLTDIQCQALGYSGRNNPCTEDKICQQNPTESHTAGIANYKCL